MGRRFLAAVVVLGLVMSACAAAAPVASNPPAPSPPASMDTSAQPSGSMPQSGAPWLNDGPITPGRYSYEIENDCEPGPLCPTAGRPASPLRMEITVPEGWEAWLDFSVILPSTPSQTEGPDGAGLVLGWTSFWVGLNSDPCLPVAHVPPDIPVGPTVDDFVEAVLAHPALDVSEPTDVELGGYGGRFLSLTGPSDISGCDNWRPWDPGFFVQGPDNLWDIWVIDADGFRVLIIAEHFPDTPADIKAELRAMVESIQFVP